MGAAGEILSRQRYGEPSFFPLGLASHVDLLDELADLHVQLDALLANQAAILARFGTRELPSATKPACRWRISPLPAYTEVCNGRRNVRHFGFTPRA